MRPGFFTKLEIEPHHLARNHSAQNHSANYAGRKQAQNHSVQKLVEQKPKLRRTTEKIYAANNRKIYAAQHHETQNYAAQMHKIMNHNIMLAPFLPKEQVFSPPAFLEWAIPDDLLAANARILTDCPIEGLSDITTALDKRTGRSWKPKGTTKAIAFFHEGPDGQLDEANLFQLRYIEGGPDGQRYEAKKGSGHKVFTPTLPPQYRQQIADKWAIDIPAEGSIRHWKSANPALPIFKCEGPAKALALGGIGYFAIASFGVFGGVERKEAPELIKTIKRRSGKADVQIFGPEQRLSAPRLAKGITDLFPADSGQRYVIVPDMDASPKTRRIVANAALAEARLLEAKGCSVGIAFWDPALGKGIDDVLRQHGPAVVDAILEAPLTPTQYRLSVELSIGVNLTPAITVSTRSLGINLDLALLSDIGIVLTDSPMGTGKSELLSKMVAGKTVLGLSPLKSLASKQARDLALDYRNDGNYSQAIGAFMSEGGEVLSDRLAMCNPLLGMLNPATQFGGQPLDELVLDEVTHTIRDLLIGQNCRADRIAIINRFHELVFTAKRIDAFDADLSQTEIDIILDLRRDFKGQFNPPEKLTTQYIKNEYRPDPWETFWIAHEGRETIGSAIELQAQILADQYAPKGIVHWAMDALSQTEKAALHLETAHGIKAAIVNARRIANKDPLCQLAVSGDIPALQAMGVKVIITSPSITQGVSWIYPGVFSAVFGSFTGASITPRQMRQALNRVREPLPRILWAPKYNNFPGKWGSDTNPNAIRDRILQTKGTSANLLGEAATVLDPETLRAVEATAKLIATDNLWRATPADSLKTLITHAGHQIKPLFFRQGESNFGESYQGTSEEWEANERSQIIAAPNLTLAEYNHLKDDRSKKAKTLEQTYAILKFEACSFYHIKGDELSDEILRIDDTGRLRRKVRSLEALYTPGGFAETEQHVRESLSLFAADTSKSLLSTKIRQAIGLPAILTFLDEGGEINADHSLTQDLYQKAIANAPAIKAALNYTVSAKSKPMNVVADLLGQLGVKLSSRRHRARDGIIRLYALEADSWAFLKATIDRRDADRGAINQGDPPGSIKNKDPGGSPPPIAETPALTWFTPEALEDIRQQHAALGETIADWIPAQAIQAALRDQNRVKINPD